MHLRWDKKLHLLVFLSSVLFLILFLSMALTDRREYQHDIDKVDRDQGSAEVVTQGAAAIFSTTASTRSRASRCLPGSPLTINAKCDRGRPAGAKHVAAERHHSRQGPGFCAHAARSGDERGSGNARCRRRRRSPAARRTPGQSPDRDSRREQRA